MNGYIDNINSTLYEELKRTVSHGCNISIAAASFSIYAYESLKNEFEQLNELRFLFTKPTFIKGDIARAQKEQREFYIPKLDRERSLYGTEFEIKLKNQLSQKAIAKECADWIRRKAKFYTNISELDVHNGFITVNGQNQSTIAFGPVNDFNKTELGLEQGNYLGFGINIIEAPVANNYINQFNKIWNDSQKLQDVTEAVLENIENIYRENSPDFIYFVTIYNIFHEFLDDVTSDELANEATGFKKSAIWNKLYDFQQEACLAIINKLEKFNGCILADSVGLGKTFTALSVIKYYENKNRNVLVLCPKKLAENWNTYKGNYINNPLVADRFNYDVLFHTDLSRHSGYSNGFDLSRINWGNYDLVVIDESHNFRNGTGTHSGTHENRYIQLMEKVIKAGIKTKVLMLSATPVNNRFVDLKNQLALAYEGNSEEFYSKLGTEKSIDEIIIQAQRAFSEWSKQQIEERTTESLSRKLDFDFFKLLDNVTIARSRKHIAKYYNMSAIGKFPTRLKPISLRPSLTDLPEAISYKQIYEQLLCLTLSVYTPSKFILASRQDKYSKYSPHNLTQVGREEGIRRLMRINLLKRLESSVNSFRLTLERVISVITSTIDVIDRFKEDGSSSITIDDLYENDFDYDDANLENFVGSQAPIDLADMDYCSWKQELEADKEVLLKLNRQVAIITPEHDSKLQELLSRIKEKVQHPINGNNKKVLVFTAFADTAEYLYDNISCVLKRDLGLESGVITGAIDGKTTVNGFKSTFNNVLTCFSPISKERDSLLPGTTTDIDVLIATDCISEGQNLQDCDYLVNYDIHWNPVRIIQRFGRIDRIGSKNEEIQLVNFWPDVNLDEYINLKGRVETRMKITVMTATGDDDLINIDEKGDLEYRRNQLQRLHDEVIDLEDMTNGISIVDLGLNEFRQDLIEYMKTNGDIEHTPHGLHAVVAKSETLPEGVIFVLKNKTGEINIGKKNRLHPFYMVYLDNAGNVVTNYLAPKELLDNMRALSKGKIEPVKDLCRAFNRETADGKRMNKYSRLLSKAVESIVDVRSGSAIDSFLDGEQGELFDKVPTGMDDFELISFFVVK